MSYYTGLKGYVPQHRYRIFFKYRHQMPLYKSPIIQILSRDRIVLTPRDTLSEIAEAYYGNYAFYLAIGLVNNIENPDIVMPGLRLSLPTLNEANDIMNWLNTL